MTCVVLPQEEDDFDDSASLHLGSTGWTGYKGADDAAVSNERATTTAAEGGAGQLHPTQKLGANSG